MTDMSVTDPSLLHTGNRALFVLSAVIFALIFILLLDKKRLCSGFQCMSMEELSLFQIKEVYQDDDSAYRALLSKDGDLLRANIRSGVSVSESNSHIQAQMSKIKALFENAASPYPGEISDEIECSDEYKPDFSLENINGVEVSYFTGYLNSRLILGACTEDQIVYKEIFALFYCPKQQQLFQIELIAPKDVFGADEVKYQKMLHSLDCHSNSL
jgi:hypothetical protein